MVRDILYTRAKALGLTVSDVVGRVVNSSNYFVRKRKRSTTERLLGGETKDPHLSILKAHIEALGGKIQVAWTEEDGQIKIVQL